MCFFIRPELVKNRETSSPLSAIRAIVSAVTGFFLRCVFFKAYLSSRSIFRIQELATRPFYMAPERCDATARHLPLRLMKVSVKPIVAVSGWPLKVPTCAALPITTAASP